MLPGPPATAEEYGAFLDRFKYEVADDLGLREKIAEVGWPNMTARECGRIGGRMGGKIGGNMVKRMIAFAEQNMA